MNTNLIMIKNQTKHSSKFYLLLLSLVVFLMAGPANAARIYFEPPPTSYRVGDEFTLSLFLDTDDQAINAVDINILVPKLLKIKNISKNGSIIQLWVNEPSFTDGAINLTGGIPGGTTVLKGTIAKITFEATAIGEGNIAFMSDSSVLLNDGQGTKLDLKTAGGPVFKVIPRPKGVITATPKPEEFSKETFKKEDKKRPEKFEILFGKDPRVFSGEDFLSFFTVDVDSGVDHYEVKLGKEPFKIAKSPYLIKDVGPRTVIRVRAYDTAGNYAESVYPGLLKRFWWWTIQFF